MNKKNEISKPIEEEYDFTKQYNLFREYVRKPQAEINAVFDTGMFNEIVAGYMTLVLFEQNKSLSEIREAKDILYGLFAEVSAKQADLTARIF